MNIQISNFKNREELENHIIQKHGKTTEKKPDVIVGSRADLEHFQLSEDSKVWGCEVQVVGEKKKKSPQFERPNRGETKKFGINIKRKK